MFWRFYRCWLASTGMVDIGPDPLGRPAGAFEWPLTDEGRSVLMMLKATRDPEFEALPMAAVIDAVLAADGGRAGRDREAALRAPSSARCPVAGTSSSARTSARRG
ncbi:hypothetical protein AB5I41_25265 [Sphingomonas sp. MMS24-JH45]